jgi:hypothetical protein
MRKHRAIAGIAYLLMLVACSGAPGPGGASSGSPSPSAVTETLPGATASESDPSAPKALTGDWEELGHEEFLELRLGMSKEAAVRTGRISVGQTVGRCTGFYLAMYGDGAGLGAHGYFTRGRGLSVIHGQGGMHTPEGIGLGSPTAALQDSYSRLVGSPAFMTAAVSDRSSYFFISENNTVASFGLSLSGDPCLTKALS